MPAPAAKTAQPVLPVPAPAAAAPAAGAKPAAPPRKPAAPAANVLLTLSLPASVKLNDKFTVQVNGSGIQNLHNAVFVINYNPELLEVVTQSEGGFLKQGGAPSTFQAFADKKKGELWISAARQLDAEGASGSGALASVTFKAIGTGTAGISFTNTNFSQKGGVQLPVTPFKSVVEVK